MPMRATHLRSRQLAVLPPSQQGILHTVDGWYEVEVPAHNVEWPQKCACCGRESVTTIDAAFTTEFVNSSTPLPQPPQVPYCFQCEDHVGAITRIEGEPLEATANIAGASSCAIFLGYHWLASQFPALVPPAGFPLWPGVLSGGVFVLVALYNDRSGQRKMKTIEAGLNTSCAHVRVAVLYGGRRQIPYPCRIYRFKNEQYAHEFKRLNPLPLGVTVTRRT
jgi:hypothetical protein